MIDSAATGSTDVAAGSTDLPAGAPATTEPCGDVPGCDGHGGCGGHGGGGCHHAPAYTPVLDARTIDPLIRQSAIFGVLVGLPPHAAVTVITEQDPAPIADLLHERLPGEYEVATEPTDDAAFTVTFARV